MFFILSHTYLEFLPRGLFNLVKMMSLRGKPVSKLGENLINKPFNPIKKKPSWIGSKILDSKIFFKTKEVVYQNGLNNQY